MKGRAVFTSAQAEKIRQLPRQKHGASRGEQKRIRRRLREIGFYLSDWGASTVSDFDSLVSQGSVRISDGEARADRASSRLREFVESPPRPPAQQSDESYVIDLCDLVLDKTASRQHRFPFLVGDSGVPLPVDAYYASLHIAVEYGERQHTESVPFFDRRQTVSGVSRGKQRAIYDQLRRELLPQHDITLVELSYSDFAHDNRKRLLRMPAADAEVIRQRLADWL